MSVRKSEFLTERDNRRELFFETRSNIPNIYIYIYLVLEIFTSNYVEICTPQWTYIYSLNTRVNDDTLFGFEIL